MGSSLSSTIDILLWATARGCDGILHDVKTKKIKEGLKPLREPARCVLYYGVAGCVCDCCSYCCASVACADSYGPIALTCGRHASRIASADSCIEKAANAPFVAPLIISATLKREIRLHPSGPRNGFSQNPLTPYLRSYPPGIWRRSRFRRNGLSRFNESKITSSSTMKCARVRRP